MNPAVDNDYYLSTHCDPDEGGCGAKPGETCAASCYTNDPDDSYDPEWRDVDYDAEYDRYLEFGWEI